MKLTPFVKRNIHKFLRSVGYQCSRIEPDFLEDYLVRQQKLFNNFAIDTLFDVGANVGKYGKLMRQEIDFKGKIISFEPMSYEFSQLSALTQEDSLWEAENFALGKENGKGEIQIAGNSVCSSLLPMLPSVVEVCGDGATYVGKEEISVKTLDSIFNEYYTGDEKVFLKIDTQGYEQAVLEGALSSLPNILGLQVELSFIRFYDGDILFNEMIKYIDNLGFKLMSIEPLLDDPKTGRQLQVDGLFFRE